MKAVGEILNPRGGCSSELLGYTECSREALPVLPSPSLSLPSPALRGPTSPCPTEGALVETSCTSKMSPAMTQACSSPSTSRAPRDTIEGSFFAAVCGIFVIMAVALGTVYFLKVARQRAGTQLASVRRRTCETRDCQRHALLLTVGLNRSADPCHDFGAYVCSAWSPAGGGSRSRRGRSTEEAFESQLNDVLIAWLGGLEDLLISGLDVEKVASKPLALLRSCRKRGPRASTDDLDEFREFIVLLGLCWPDDNCCDVSALGVLLGLVYRWDLCFWLRMRVLRSSKSNGTARRLALYPGPRFVVQRFAARHTHLVTKDAYVAYWTHHRDALLTQSTSNGSSRHLPPARESIERVVKAEHAIASALWRSAAKESLVPMNVTISDFGFYTGKVSSKEWLDKLNANVADESTLFAMEDHVLVADASVLEAMGTIFGAHTDREIVAHLSWQFVQEYGAVVDPGLGRLFEDGWDGAFCARQVERIYAPLVATLHWKLRTGHAERQLLEAKLRSLVDRTARMVDTQWWLAQPDRRVAVDKLRALTIRLWLPNELQQKLGLVYRDFPNGTAADESFAKTWIRSRRALARQASGHFRESLASYSPALSPLVVGYDYLDNAVDVAAASLTGPLYYANATPAMFYGGIGFYFTAHMMRSLDWTGLRVGADGRIVSPSWMSETSRKVVESRLSCPTTGVTNRALLPYLPALEVVRQAFFEDAATSAHRLEIGDALTEPRTFFMTLCHIVCSSMPWAGAAVDCNAVLKNSRDFAATYRCKIDSPMNPSRKCGFFS
nr:neprilysin-11-like [Dermacentor andersoni]